MKTLQPHRSGAPVPVMSASVRQSLGGERRRDIWRLRLRLCALYGVTSCLGLVVLATLVTVVDGHSRTEALRGELRRRASLAAALAYPDESGLVQTAAIEDDGVVTDGLVDLLLFDATDHRRLRLVCAVSADGSACGESQAGERWEPFRLLADDDFVREALEEEVDTGTSGEVVMASRVRRAAVAVPLYDGPISSGVLVAVDRGSLGAASEPHDGLVMWTWIGCGLLALASTVAGWWVAGRSLRPSIVALDQQERFLTDAAHELRTPVSRVRAVAESALLGMDELTALLPPRSRRDLRVQSKLDEMQTDLRRTVELAMVNGRVVADLLLMARIDSRAVDLRRRPVRLDHLASRLEQDHPDVVVDLDEPLTVLGDEVLLRRVLENLIDNARSHGQPPDGAPPPPIEVTVQRSPQGDGAVLSVADYGPGIPPALLTRAFQRFDGRADTPGTGLGLAIVSWIVARHGGAITARNRRPPEHGAILEVSLPLADAR